METYSDVLKIVLVEVVANALYNLAKFTSFQRIYFWGKCCIISKYVLFIKT